MCQSVNSACCAVGLHRVPGQRPARRQDTRRRGQKYPPSKIPRGRMPLRSAVLACLFWLCGQRTQRTTFANMPQFHARCRLRHPTMLVAMLLHVLLLSGPQQARADSEAPMVWPRPASLSHGACNGGSPLGLAGAQLQVRVLSGQADEATAYVEAALQAALPEWGCGIEAGPAATGGGGDRQLPTPPKMSSACATNRLPALKLTIYGLPALPRLSSNPSRAGPTISVVIANASCTQPSCYSHENDESYSLQIDEAGAITIAAAEIFGANWALSTLSSLANGTCGLTCLPIEGLSAWCASPVRQWWLGRG